MLSAEDLQLVTEHKDLHLFRVQGAKARKTNSMMRFNAR